MVDEFCIKEVKERMRTARKITGNKERPSSIAGSKGGRVQLKALARACFPYTTGSNYDVKHDNHNSLSSTAWAGKKKVDKR